MHDDFHVGVTVWIHDALYNTSSFYWLTVACQVLLTSRLSSKHS
jgi:hypothetical protein